MKLKPQIFCFTYAGGAASFFDEISKELPEAEFVKLEYPGHGTRHREQLSSNWNELTEDLYRQIISAYKGGPYALFGYSMGTISAVELLRRVLQERVLSAPSIVFLAAHEPRTKSVLATFSSTERDDLVKERTIRFGAVPETLIDNRSFWRMYLPLLRADYALIGQYHFDELELKTDIPAVVFYSETDTPSEEMEQWRHYFTGICELIPYEGTHFFIKTHKKEMAEVMRQRLCG